jgi:hypothetical protein
LVCDSRTEFCPSKCATTHPTILVRRWSYIKTAAVRIGNDVLEVSGGKERKYWVNGVEGSYDADFEFSSLNLKVNANHIEECNCTRVRIDLDNADAIGFETMKDFVRVNVHQTDPKWKKFANARGLMGSHPYGVTFARDGDTIIEDSNAFAQEWQVLATEPTLFHTIEGPQHPTKCIMPTELPKEEQRRHLGESIISRDDAELACAHVLNGDERDACIFDVMATNDKEIAFAY